MPIYEFFSPNTNKIYSFYSRRLISSKDVPNCPDGKNFPMEKLISGFSITGKNGKDEELNNGIEDNTESDPFAKLDDNQSAHVMKEMEKAMSGMDDENPDPRQMGSLMRRMCEMTGEKMDNVMEEVVRKLEEGANPEELEAKMEGIIDDADATEEGNEGAQTSKARKQKSRMLLTRDPELYEMEDFLPR